MSDEEARQAARYDAMAAGYAQYWAPVLAPSASRLLERLDPVVADGARSIIDIGVGTGNLALPALARWPAARVTGIDASSEMVGAARVLAGDLADGASDRFEARVAFAADLPFEEASFDVAMSSFVLQLVPSRPKALREIRRVLRPGGTFSYVSWLTDRTPFAPDRIFDALLVESGFEEESGEDARPGDIPSVQVAAAEMRRAGFRAVAADGAMLSHAFTVDSYLAFLTEYDEVSLFEDEMTRAERRRFLITLRERLMALSEDDLVFRAPIVYASGIRSDG
jgi:ubiquinone/menaquinone biosynthesis C-methylase UbiE